MKKRFLVFLLLCLLSMAGFSQHDTASGPFTATAFERIMTGLKDFRLDTTAPPNDRITKKIIELRALRGGFNINEAIAFKLEEDRQKGELPKATGEKLAAFFTSGDGRRWLDNAVVWIYRRNFDYGELKTLVKFYKTPAGQKMATEFPVIMLQSLRAGEMIKASFDQQQGKQ